MVDQGSSLKRSRSVREAFASVRKRSQAFASVREAFAKRSRVSRVCRSRVPAPSPRPPGPRTRPRAPSPSPQPWPPGPPSPQPPAPQPSPQPPRLPTQDLPRFAQLLTGSSGGTGPGSVAGSVSAGPAASTFMAIAQAASARTARSRWNSS